MELLKIDGDLDDLITRRASARELTKAAQKHGFRTLAEDGVRRVLDGTTSLQEVLRVVDLTERM
jgi:general secretion pathway protein E/type IV pilus assembly protein PilB